MTFRDRSKSSTILRKGNRWSFLSDPPPPSKRKPNERWKSYVGGKLYIDFTLRLTASRMLPVLFRLKEKHVVQNILKLQMYKNNKIIQRCLTVTESMTWGSDPPAPYETNFLFWESLNFLNGPLWCMVWRHYHLTYHHPAGTVRSLNQCDSVRSLNQCDLFRSELILNQSKV